MTSDSFCSRARKRRSTALSMFGSKNGSARFLSRGCRKFSVAEISSRPRLTRHCASKGEILSDDASCPARSGCDGASDQRNFIFVLIFRAARPQWKTLLRLKELRRLRLMKLLLEFPFETIV